MNFSPSQNIHFVGIGGIGMSALAKIMHARGHTVSGSDACASAITEQLATLGCTVHIGHTKQNVHNVDLVVYSTAISSYNPEIAAAHEQSIPIVHRSKLLAHIMATSTSIGITGTHGKTTTTSLVGHILMTCDRDPTLISGGILKNIDSNAHVGTSNLTVAEVDESDKSLLSYTCSYGLITNIEHDHVEHYKDLAQTKEIFSTFLNATKKHVFACSDDAGVRSTMPSLTIPITTYGLRSDAYIHAENITLSGSHTTCTIIENDTKLGTAHIPLAGKHNIQNTLGAIAVARHLGIPFEKIANGLKTFKGIVRRFDKKGMLNGAIIYDDYAHHPTEIEATLTAAKAQAPKRIIAIFEPHRYTRTKELWNDFIKTLAGSPIDELYLTDIYPASEPPIPGITSKNLISAIKAYRPELIAKHLVSYKDAVNMISKRVHPGDMLLMLGAGNLDQLAEQLTSSSDD
jgi:UDP-N-acetylmuramate--alanine ligase